MSPKMRSIFAQVHRKSVSMGSRRNFSSSSAAGDRKASSDSYVDGFEMANMFSFVASVKLGFLVWGSVGCYRVYYNFYPKLLIHQEEHRIRVRRQRELLGQMDNSRKSP